MNVNALVKAAKGSVKFLKHNAPLIFQAAGIAGMVAGTIYTGKVAPMAYDILENYREEKEEKGETYPNKLVEIASETALMVKYYGPVVLLDAMSIASLIFSYRINMARIAALSSALAISDKQFKEYRDKVKELFSDENKDADSEVKQAIMQDHINDGMICTDEADGVQYQVINDDLVENIGGNVLIKDEVTGKIFYGTKNLVEFAFIELNKRLPGEMWMSVNELYDILNIRHAGNGFDMIGFDTDDYGSRGVMIEWLQPEMTPGGQQSMMVFTYDWSGKKITHRYY